MVSNACEELEIIEMKYYPGSILNWDQMHCVVKIKLIEKYPEDIFPETLLSKDLRQLAKNLFVLMCFLSISYH